MVISLLKLLVWSVTSNVLFTLNSALQSPKLKSIVTHVRMYVYVSPFNYIMMTNRNMVQYRIVLETSFLGVTSYATGS